MKTVLSLSGGKSSAYIYANYKQDYNIFALMLNEDQKCGFNDWKKNQIISDKIGADFIGTPESLLTLDVILDLEQKYGKKIHWVAGETFEQMTLPYNRLPNQNMRFCTIKGKLYPVFEWCFKNTDLPVKMQIGFRHDEENRAKKLTDTIDYKSAQNLFGDNRYKWSTIKWRLFDLPLIDDMIDHYAVNQFWKNKDIIFPKDSNCQMCFWKRPQQLRKNFDDSNSIMKWGQQMEKKTGRQFRHDMSLEQIEKIGLQQEFIFGTGAGCSADGFCTD